MEDFKKKVAILMGSKSDESVMKPASEVLESFGIEYEIIVSSAHRMPNRTRQFAADAQKNGFEVIIAGAGKAAHLRVSLHPIQLFGNRCAD